VQAGLGPAATRKTPESGPADGACEEADPEGGERRHGAAPGVELGKEQLVEDECGGRAVDEEVIPFERRTDGRSDGHARAVRLLSGKICGHAGLCHGLPPLGSLFWATTRDV